ncbi:thioesterase family protein [Staphylococcus sp. SQ8-PEA]|uniref:Thioesterase family protein n=1 Tax=Staphylococcus marylandisciuri TaxID=2981529 RepID=A0ABT2QMN2_9STAP|nr:thioesterase family protein [Staphylococcus marylandisciuri]MCU5745243.1 thioesterase family protein [Staphylococcus marylandisciuri]
MSEIFTVSRSVPKTYIDHNHHMHDAYYNVVFSEVINEFNYNHGLSLKEREQYQYTLFTAEEHTAYLAQLKENDPFKVYVYIYNYDVKRIHFVLLLYKEDGTLAATNETMMLGINTAIERTAPFPESYLKELKVYYAQQPQVQWPKQIGTCLGITK